MGRWTAQGWPVHGSTMDSTVADGWGSPELSLMAALGHGGLPRGWQGKVATWHDRGNRSAELGEWRGGGTPAVGLWLQAAMAQARMRRGGGEVLHRSMGALL
jgi:hypothetical protein